MNILKNFTVVKDFHLWTDNEGDYIVVKHIDENKKLQLVYPPNKKEVRKGITWQDKVQKAMREVENSNNRLFEASSVIKRIKAIFQ